MRHNDFWRGNGPWGFQDLHPFSRVKLRDPEDTEPHMCMAGEIHRNETAPLQLGRQFAFNQNGWGVLERTPQAQILTATTIDIISEEGRGKDARILKSGWPKF